MLKDRVAITIKSGKGGHGSLAENLRCAVGGDGGDGGDVYMIGDENIYDLCSYDSQNEYKAGRGEDGGKRRKKGQDGRPLILKVPLTTEVHIDNRVPFIVKKHKQKFKILSGGKGGLGSITIAKRHYAQLHGQNGFTDGKFGKDWDAKFAQAAAQDSEDKNAYLGLDGDVKHILLLLKLSSDVIFIGYPNAGKSSLLNSLTASRVKTAAYAFTTLEPQIALLDGLRLMDLPGLIEGTFEGKGLGTSFVKHTETSRLVAHVISYENADPLAMYKSLRKELEAIDPKLAAKPEFIVLTKTDEVDEKTIKKTEKIFQKLGLETVSVSIIDEEALTRLKDLLKSELQKQLQ